MRSFLALAAVLLGLSLGVPRFTMGEEFPDFEMQEIDPYVGRVCYALTTADVDGDGRIDVVALSENALVWYANPSWEKQIIIHDVTERDNVAIQAHDIDGDGRIDFVVGAGWRPADTESGGTLQWVTRDEQDQWVVHPIGAEPSLHRFRWGDVLGTGREQLVVAPLQGRGTRGPRWDEGPGVRVLVFQVPEDPVHDAWPFEVADDALHTIHNLQLIDVTGDGQLDILLAAWEGVFLVTRDDQGGWARTQLGTGNQEAEPFKGASEIKLGTLADGRRYIATIEPWHGHQVVVYTPPESGEGLWDRQVIDEPVQWGHAVWCADLDGDGDEELIIGQRDPNPESTEGPIGPGVRVYDPRRGSEPLAFTRHLIDDGGVAVEDLVAADLDGDGRPDLIAGGRATHNVRIYWNRGPKE